MNQASSNDIVDASIVRGSSNADNMMVVGRFHANCYDAQGNLKWTEDFDNLVTDQGKKHLLDNGLAGPATAVNVRMSLFTAGAPAATWTYATPGYTECVTGTVGATRPTPTFSAASGAGTVSKATSSAVAFSIGATGATITGAAINLIVGAVGNVANTGDTATAGAILYSAGTFSSSKTVTSGDTLNVSYTSSLT